VYRDNHLGDGGTQFGKQIYAIKEWGDEEQISQAENPVKELVKLYVKFHQEAEADPSLVDEGRAWFKKLEEGDAEARRLWQRCIEWSWQEFEKIYDLLDVEFTENQGRGYGESYFEDKMEPVIAELEEAGLLTDSEGAKLVFFPDDKYPPLMIVKKDGTTLYATRDLATDKFRLEQYPPLEMIVNEVGAEQSLYFQQIFEIEQMLGWYQPGQRVHLGHGMYRFKDKKMSTRKGNVIWLADVLGQAFERVQNRAEKPLDDETSWKIAVSAIKWQDLHREAKKNIVFDYDQMLSLEGNSGPYMQYTQVRSQSVIRKAERSITKPIDTLLNREVGLSQNSQVSPEVGDLLRNLYQYCEIVTHTADELAPHHLATYLYQLAQNFNTFYNQHQIVPNGETAEWDDQHLLRLQLTAAVSKVLEHGLGLLGIETVERM
jgi:arginyl-tRNA synthetase